MRRRPALAARRTLLSARLPGCWRHSTGVSRGSALLLLLPSGVAAALGVWQLQRREWKVEQLAERARELVAEPQRLTELAAAGAALPEWRRVRCVGELRHDAARYVRAAAARQPLRAPCLLDDSHWRAGRPARAHRRRHRALRLPAGARRRTALLAPPAALTRACHARSAAD